MQKAKMSKEEFDKYYEITEDTQATPLPTADEDIPKENTTPDIDSEPLLSPEEQEYEDTYIAAIMEDSE